MRRFGLRDVNLVVAILAMLVMACLAGFGWYCTVVMQRSRETSIAISAQYQLLGAIDDGLRAVELAQLRYSLSNSEKDLIGSRNAALRVDVLAASLNGRATSAPATRLLLATVMQQVLARQPAHSPMAAAGRALKLERSMARDKVTNAIRRLRWIVSLLAVLGIVAVLSLVRLLRLAWRRLQRAETAQRLLAQQLRGCLDSLSQGVAVFDTQGLLLHWNVCLRRMLELPPGLLRPGLHYDILEQHLVLDGVAFLEPLQAIHADRLRVGEGTAGELDPRVCERVLQQAGNTGGMQIEIRRTLMRQDGFVLTLTDMTEQVQTERMLHEAQKMQALGQLSGGIAHDFNNILTVILGSLELDAAASALPPGQQVAMLNTRMQRAARAAENGAALTRQLLAFARKQAPAPQDMAREPPLAPQDLDFILEELVPLLRHTIGDRIELTCRVEPGLWPIVAEAGQLESVVLNLALNARDAMPAGGRISIAASNVSVDARGAALHANLIPGEHVCISVADTGTGMGPEVIAHAFEPFFTTKPEGSGTGLGLAMVSGFARQSGGAAVIQSEPEAATGTGTVITLYLPRAVASPAPLREAASSPSAFVMHPTRPRRILVVENDALVREITVDILRELGYRVSEAADAELALRSIGLPHDPIDLLLTDLRLPGALDGRQLAVRVGQMSPDTRILTMSGSLDGVGPQEARNELNPGHWIGKPFRAAQLAAKVQALIGDARGAQDDEAA